MLITFADVEPRSSIEPARDEMLAISTEISKRFAPKKPTPPPPAAGDQIIQGFSRNELLTIGEDVSRRYAPKAASTQSELLLLPVDPQHLYAFWETGAAAQAPEQPLTLRIYWQPDPAQKTQRSHIWFDVPADAGAHRKQVRLPVDDTYYTAALGHLRPDRSMEVLAQSNRVHVPTLPGKPRGAPAQAGPEPAAAVRQLQSVIGAAEPQGTHFSESWAIKLHPHHSAAPARDLTQLYVELMSIFKTYRIDAELIPTAAPIAEAELPDVYASGLGRLFDSD